MRISAALAVVLYLTPVNENVLIYDLRTGRKKKKNDILYLILFIWENR